MSIADFQLPIVKFACFAPIDNRQLKIGNSNDPFGRTRNPKVCSSKSAIANEFLDGFRRDKCFFYASLLEFFSLKVVPVNWNSNCIVTIELLSPPECAHRIPKAPTLIRQFRKELSATHDGNQGDSL